MNDTADRARLKRAIAEKFGIQSDIAILGDGAGRIYDNTQKGYVYVRVLNSVSDTGKPVYSAPFTVRHSPNAQYNVADGTQVQLYIDRDGELAIEGADFMGMVAVNKHPAQFNSGTPETRFVNPSSLITLKSFAIANGGTPTLKIGVQALLYITNANTFNFFAGAQYDFTADVPVTSGKKALAVVYLDTATNTLDSVVGSDKDAILNFDVDDYTEVVGLLPTTALPSGMWVLTNGMTTITEKQLQLDLRQWMNLPAVAGFTSFDVDGNSGPTQTITNNDTLTFEGIGGITTVATATDKIQIDGSSFVQSFNVVGSAGPSQAITNGNTLSLLGAGGIVTTGSATDTVTFDGSAFVQSFTVAGDSGSAVIENSDSFFILGSDGITVTKTPMTNIFSVNGLNAGRVGFIAGGALSGTSVTISSIPSTYTHLRLYIYARSGNASEEFLVLRVGNGGIDSAAGSYARSAIYTIGSTVTGFGDNGLAANIFTLCSAGLSGVPNRFSSSIVEFPHYKITSTHKNITYVHKNSIGSLVADQKYVTGGGHWLNSTSAIDTISIILGSGGSFATGSTYSLIGIIGE